MRQMNFSVFTKCVIVWRLNAEDKDNSAILAKQMEEKLKADCATLEAQEIAAFDAEVAYNQL